MYVRDVLCMWGACDDSILLPQRETLVVVPDLWQLNKKRIVIFSCVTSHF